MAAERRGDQKVADGGAEFAKRRFSARCDDIATKRMTARGWWQRQAPKSVIVDPSCDDVPAAHDPVIQKQALDAYAQAIVPGSDGLRTEHGFMASKNFLGGGYSAGPIFRSEHQTEIDPDRHIPGRIMSFLNGVYTPDLFVHTHQTWEPPRPVSDPDDLKAAKYHGIRFAAIDGSGRLTCTPPLRSRK